MRTAAQLLADARSTGTFDSYEGDGASIPLATFDTPAGVPLALYKAYLDMRFSLAFKLHDWCYTPLATRIGVTQAEADRALWEMLAGADPVNAEIVYRAVRVGGVLFFGRGDVRARRPRYQRWLRLLLGKER